MSGRVYGTAGGSLNGAGNTFAANDQVAKFGAQGEKKSAAILNELAKSGPAVLHDLKIPNQRYTANIDHIVVSGNRVWIIDSKTWVGNFYWTLGGATYRGLKRFASKARDGKTSYPAEKKTLPMAKDAIAAYLGIPATQIRLALIIWPTGPKPLNTIFFRSPGGARTLNGKALNALTAGAIFGRKPANQAITSKLAALVI